MEKQRKQVETGVVDVFNGNVRPKMGQRKNQPIHPPSRDEEGAEENEEEPAETEESKEKVELDLVPIVESVFGQVRLHKSTPCRSPFISHSHVAISYPSTYSSLLVVYYLQFCEINECKFYMLDRTRVTKTMSDQTITTLHQRPHYTAKGP